MFPSLAILLLVLTATIAGIRYNDSRDPRTRGASSVADSSMLVYFAKFAREEEPLRRGTKTVSFSMWFANW